MSSLALYASLRFEVKEPTVFMEGRIAGELPRGVEVRPMAEGYLREGCFSARVFPGLPRKSFLHGR